MVFLTTARLCILAALPVAVQAAAGGFLRTCRNITLADGSGNVNAAAFKGFLGATCRSTVDDTEIWTSFDLNLCVGVDHTTDTLIWTPMGKFRNYCKTCSLNNPAELECVCGASRRDAKLNLDQQVTNKDGTLTCGDWAQ